MDDTAARRNSKKQGALTAKEWLRVARQLDKIQLVASERTYGFTLDELRNEGIALPLTNDRDFSWGFYKQVKGHVYHALRRRLLRRDAETSWDLFISHASEDKETIVRELATQLRNRGLRVWYDEFTLKLGDSLRRSIDNGLANSRYGMVLLSEAYLKKEWAQKELDALFSLEIAGIKVILPVWHNISIEFVRKHSPLLADRVAGNTAEGISSIVNKVMRAIE